MKNLWRGYSWRRKITPTHMLLGRLKKLVVFKCMNVVRCPSLLASIMMRCTLMWWIWMDMDACHILFERPWQYDVDAKHLGKSKLYQLEKGGIKYTLVPFTRKNQPKALQVEGKNFLTFVHDPSLLMGECKETREVHLMGVKGEVESSDLVEA